VVCRARLDSLDPGSDVVGQRSDASGNSGPVFTGLLRIRQIVVEDRERALAQRLFVAHAGLQHQLIHH